MAPRPPVAFAVGAIACAVLAGCSDSGSRQAAMPVTRHEYIDAVDGLMDPPAQLASVISERGDAGSTGPGKRRLDALVTNAQGRLATFRAMVLDDAIVRHQRDGIARAYAEMIPRMRRAAAALESRPGQPSSSAVDPFLISLRDLPSAAASPSR